jgi:hypothetical protein
MGHRPDRDPTIPPPLIILGSPRSFTSLICAMLGQHPQAYGVPELNLFLADTLEDLIDAMSGYKQIQLHGLLRTVAHLSCGEQTLLSLGAARRWMIPRLKRSTGEVYRELCHKIRPLRIVDKSPAYSEKPETLERLHAALPEAYYLHLVRNPRTQGESIMKVGNGIMAIMVNSIDYETDPPTIDPQLSWLEVQRNILSLLEGVPDERKMRLRGEDVLNDREAYLGRICRWLGIDDGPRAMKAMQHPEDSPFASLGPLGAHLGNDINFLRSPALREGTIRCPALDGPLSWRPDGKGLNDEVLAMARELDYE